MINTQSSTREQRNDQYRQKLLGTRLKRLYLEVAEEAVPDDFLNLLEQAQHKSRK